MLIAATSFPAKSASAATRGLIRLLALSLTVSLVSLSLPVQDAAARAPSRPAEVVGKEAASTASVASSAKRNPAAVALGEKVLQALGGYEAYKAFNDKPCRASGKIIQTSGLSGSVNSFNCELVVKREKEKITITLLGQPLTTVYDGKICWTKQGDTVLPADAITARRIEEDIQHGLLLLEAIPTARMELGKPTTIGGRACESLLIWAGDGVPTTFYIDKENSLVLGSSYPGVDLERGVKVEKLYHYEDYREVEGTKQPFIVKEFSGEQMVSETQISSVKIDESITDAEFVMPQEKLPVRLTAGSVTIPFDYVSNEILVKAKVNGTTELKFILDTGATQSILDRGVMKQLALKLDPISSAPGESLSMTTGAGSIQAEAVNFRSLSLGDMELNDVAVAVADLSGFEQVQKERPAGLIGANILKRFLVTVDYENSKIIFEDPNKSSLPEGAIVLNTKPSLGMSGLAVEGSLDGKQNISFLIDTGAAFNNVSESKVKNLVPNPLYRIGMLKGLDGKLVETGSAKFNFLDIDKLRIDGPVFSIAPSRGSDKTPAGIINSSDLAIIGNPLLSRYKVTFDYRNQRLILTQSKAQKAFYEYQSKLAPLRLDLIKNKNISVVVRELESLANSAHNKDLPGAEALVRAQLALALCQKNGGDFSPENLFRPLTAQILTGQSSTEDLKLSPYGKARAQERLKVTDKPLGASTNGAAENDKASSKSTAGQVAVRPEALLEEPEGQLLMAYNLAERSNDKSIQARVLAVWGFLYASQNPTVDYLNSAKQKIGKAVAMAPTDPEVLASSGYFLSRLESGRISARAHNIKKSEELNAGDKKENARSTGKGDGKETPKGSKSHESASGSHKLEVPISAGKGRPPIRSLEDLGKWLVDQIVDQSIMIDPANWLALWTKMERARAQGNMEEARIIQAQLKHYYPSVNVRPVLK